MNKWYITKLVFSVITGNGNHTPQFEEQIRLIEARSFNEAFLKARLIGGREEDAFITEEFNPVKWQFIDVCELTPIEDFTDGMSLHSRLFEVEESRSYIDYIHHRAEVITAQIEPQAVVA